MGSSDSDSLEFALALLKQALQRDFVVWTGGPVDLRLRNDSGHCIEVKRVTDKSLRSLLAASAKHEGWMPSQRLRYHWSVEVDTSVGANFKNLTIERFEPILLELERLGVTNPRAQRLPLSLRRSLGNLTVLASSDSALEPGVQLLVVHGLASPTDSDALMRKVEDWLNSGAPVPSKLRDQLGRVGCSVREAFLVVDTTTDMGWSLGHMRDQLPTVRIALPDEVDGVWVAQPGAVAWHYSRDGGWVDHSSDLR